MTEHEFDWIRGLARRFGSGPLPSGDLGIGDDAALIALVPGDPASPHLALSVDAQISGVHFRPGWLTDRELGFRLFQIGFSDIAAMGARPRGALLSFEVGPGYDESRRQEFMAGFAEAAEGCGVALLGGNMSARDAGFSAHIVAVGTLPDRRALWRSAAQVGDGVFVIGRLGCASAGVHALASGRGDTAPTDLLLAYRRPTARCREGRLLLESTWAHAAIDISDGLAADLGHICEASGVGALIETERIPIGNVLRDWCRTNDLDPLEFALHGGEDYALLFTAPPDAGSQRAVEASLSSFGAKCVRIGTVTNTGRLEARSDGRTTLLPATGHVHPLR